MHIVLALLAAGDPISNGLDTLRGDAGGWLAALAALAGVSTFGLHAAGLRHASEQMKTAFIGLGGAAALVYGSAWLIGLFHP